MSFLPWFDSSSPSTSRDNPVDLNGSSIQIEQVNSPSLPSFSLRVLKRRISSVFSGHGVNTSKPSLTKLKRRALLHYQQAYKTTTSGFSFCESSLKGLFDTKCPNANEVRTYDGRYREHSLFRRNTRAHQSNLSSGSAAFVNRKTFPANHFPRVIAYGRNLHEVPRYW